MEQIIIAAAALVAGGALGAWVVWSWAVRPLEGNVRALAASCDDMGWLMGQQRDRYRAESERLGERVEAEREAAETHAMVAELALSGVEFQARKRAEAVRSLDLVLEFYGNAIERAEAAELELQRERIVSDGLDALLGQERAA